MAVKLAKGITVGQTQTINFQAKHTPAGWLAEWTTQQIDFPKIPGREGDQGQRRAGGAGGR